MKRFSSKEIKKGIRTAAVLVLAALMLVSAVGIGSIQTRAEENSDSTNNYGLHNPRVAYNYRDTVIFGHYWQEDTNGDGVADQNDDKQPIVWQVLKRYDDGRACLLSDKVLDAKAFHNGNDNGDGTIDYSCTWMNSDIRVWLNGNDSGDFFHEAFNSTEQTSIETSTFTCYPIGYNGGHSNDYLAKDKVALWLCSEVQKEEFGFSSAEIDEARLAKTTKFAKSNGAYANIYGFGSWWLCTTGEETGTATWVDCDGKVNLSASVTRNNIGIRPVILINLNSSNIKNGDKKIISVIGSDWDTVSFGRYNNKDIVWRVLNVSENDAFLLSDKILELSYYNNEDVSTSWKDCSLRRWLNNEFYNSAFTDDEKKMIRKTNVINEDNPFYGTDGGDNTEDYIFIPALNDVVNSSYGFSENYSLDIGTRGDCSLGTYDWWWLRTIGKTTKSAIDINGSGKVIVEGSGINSDGEGVRPCLHIDLSKVGWTKGELVQTGNSTGGVEIPLNPEDRSDFPIESSENLDNPSDDPNNSSQGGSSGTASNQEGDKESKNSGKSDIPTNTPNTSTNPSTPNQSGTGSVKKAQNITEVKNITKAYSTKKFSLKAKTSGDGKITYTSSNKKVAKISATGKVTLVGTGKTKITIKAAGTSKYKPAQKMIVLTVKAGKQKITSKVKSKNMEYTNKPFNLGTKVLGKAKVMYKSSDPNVLKVDSKGKVTLIGIGKATITITTKKNKQYAAATKKITINVTAPKLRLNCKALTGMKVKLAWNESPVYDGYYVEIAYDSQFKDTVRGGVGNFNKGRSEAVITGFKTAGTKCYARIRPYTKVNGKEVYYSWSNTATFTVIE